MSATGCYVSRVFFFISHAESMSNKLSCEILVLSLSRICSSSAMIFHLMFLFYLHANVKPTKYEFSGEILVLIAWVVYEI